MFCNHCGNKLPDFAKFCTRCGKAMVRPVAVTPPPAPAPAPAPKPVPVPEPMPIPEPVPAPIPEPKPEPRVFTLDNMDAPPPPPPAPKIFTLDAMDAPAPAVEAPAVPVIPQPVPEPIPEPIAEPAPMPIPEPAPMPVYEAPVIPAAEEPAPAPAVMAAPTEVLTPDMLPPEPKKKKKKKRGGLILVLLLLLAAIAAAVVFGWDYLQAFLGKNPATEPTGTNPVSNTAPTAPSDPSQPTDPVDPDDGLESLWVMTGSSATDASGNQALGMEMELAEDGSILSVVYTGMMQYDMTFHYDENGTPIGLSGTNYGGQAVQIDFVLDEMGRVLAVDYLNGASYEYTYDDAGRLLTHYRFDSNDALTDSSEYTYNSAGICIYSVSTEYAADGSVKWRYEYNADQYGNIINGYTYSAGGVLDTANQYRYTYDDQGRILTDIRSNLNGTITQWLEYTYDEAGNITSLIRRNADGSVRTSTTYHFDEAGHCVQEDYVDTVNETLSYSIHRVIDSKGNLLSEYTMDHNGAPVSGKEFTYDDAGNMLTEVTVDTVSGGTLVSRTYTYDEAGNQLSNSYYDANGVLLNITTSEYTELRLTPEQLERYALLLELMKYYN